MYPGMETLSGQPVPVFNHSHSENGFLMFDWNFLHFSLCPLPSALSVGTTEKALALSFLLHPSGIYLSSPFIIFVPLHWICSSPWLSCTGKPRTGPTTLDVLHQCWAEEKDHLPWPAGDAFPNAAQDAVGHLRCKGSWRTCSPPGHSGPVGPQPVPVHFPLLNFMKFLSPNFPACRGPSEWQHNQPISVCWNISSLLMWLWHFALWGTVLTWVRL